MAHGGMQMEPPTVFLPCPLPVSTRGYSSVLGGQSWDCSIFSAKRLARWGFFCLLVGWFWFCYCFYFDRTHSIVKRSTKGKFSPLDFSKVTVMVCDCLFWQGSELSGQTPHSVGQTLLGQCSVGCAQGIGASPASYTQCTWHTHIFELSSLS